MTLPSDRQRPDRPPVHLLDSGPREALLAELGWARALARQLVQDASVADDIAQEAALVALERPPRRQRGPGLRAWLARVTHTLVRHRSRAEHGRREREQRSHSQRSEPSPLEVLERASAQRELVDAVLELGEPWASTILSRYLDELTAEQIAQRQGVTSAAVRKRLSRGLEKLRERLDARHGGERRAWLIGMGSWSELPLAPLRAASIALPVAMTTLSKTVLIASAAVALSFVGWRTLDFGQATPADHSASAVAPVATPRAPQPSPSTRAVAELETEAAPKRHPLATNRSEAQTGPAQESFLLRARVLDGEGIPIAASELAVLDSEIPATRAADDGRFELTLNPQQVEAGQQVVVEVRAQGFVPVWRRERIVFGNMVDLGEIELEVAGFVHGRVVELSGQPVAGALVCVVVPEGQDRSAEETALWGPGHHVRRYSRKTDAAGRFRFEELPLGLWQVWGHAEGSQWSSGPVQRAATGARLEPVELRIEPIGGANLVRGVVLGPEGEPVPNVVLRWALADENNDKPQEFYDSEGGRSDAEGRFALEMIAGRVVDLLAKPSLTETKLGSRTIPGVAVGGPEIVIELSQRRYLVLDVRDPDSSPVDQFRALLICEGERFGRQRFESDEAGGHARLPLPDRPFRVSVTGQQYEDFVAGPFEPMSSPEVFEIELVPHALLSGRVTAQGQPVAGALVQLYRKVQGEDRPWAYGFPATLDGKGLTYTTTESDGRYSVAIRRAGPSVVLVDSNQHELFLSEPLQLDLGQPQKLDLELPPPGVIEGHVHRADGGDPRGLVVRASRGDWRVVEARVSEDGRYRFDALAPGLWMLQTSSTREPGTATASRASGALIETRATEEDRDLPWTCRVEPNRSTRCDLEHAASGATLIARLVQDGAAATGFSMRLVEGDQAWTWTLFGNLARSVDEAGSTRWEGLQPGHKQAIWRAAAGDFQDLAIVAEVELEAGEQELLVAIESARVEGRLRGETALVTQLAGGARAITFLKGADSGESLSPRLTPAGRVKVHRRRTDDDAGDPLGWEVVASHELDPGQTLRLD